MAPSGAGQSFVPEGEESLTEFLVEQHLIRVGEELAWTPLTGGVSSEIWRIDLPDRSLCVKRALPKLKVAADWQAPVSRSAYEWAWLQFAYVICPTNIPQPLANDAKRGLFAMEFLSPELYPNWKAQLLAGNVQPSTAGAVGRVLGHLHARSAGRAEIASTFDSDENFHALRLEPYLVAAAKRHTDVGQRLLTLAERTARTHIALVHGDVSPKNILVGPKGPVFLDAECAWFGDPAFDVAFALNHLLLKGLIHPDRAPALRACFDEFTQIYLAEVTWEPPDAVERRSAELLPGLLLARCDGKSPVEYLTREDDKAMLRSVSRQLLGTPVSSLADVADLWFAALPRR